jgi:hypothetical protein
MADAPARTELKVTTGPIRGSRKIHVGDLRVAMREIDLEPTSGEPPLRVYDCSGPYTDPEARIDIMAGLPELRRTIAAAAMSRSLQRGQAGKRHVGPDRSGGVSPSPMSAIVLRLAQSARCTARKGSSRLRWNICGPESGPEWRQNLCATADFGALIRIM